MDAMNESDKTTTTNGSLNTQPSAFAHASVTDILSTLPHYRPTPSAFTARGLRAIQARFTLTLSARPLPNPCTASTWYCCFLPLLPLGLTKVEVPLGHVVYGRLSAMIYASRIPSCASRDSDESDMLVRSDIPDSIGSWWSGDLVSRGRAWCSRRGGSLDIALQRRSACLPLCLPLGSIVSQRRAED